MGKAKVIQADLGAQAVAAGAEGLDKGWTGAVDELIRTKFPPLGQGPADPGRGNLRGLSIGERLEDGMPTGEQVITIFVGRKQDAADVPSGALFEDSVEFDGKSYPVDVQELVEVYSNPRTLFSPKFGIEPKVRCGSCIGNARTTDTGTLGCLVTDRKNRLYLLSNNHVIGASNTGLLADMDDAGNFVAGKTGDEIQAPGKATGFPDPVTVGYLARFKEIRFDGGENIVDAALAYTSFKAASPSLHTDAFTLAPQMQNEPFIGMLVRKEGARTGTTTGIIVGLYAALDIPYQQGKVARFVRQLVILGVGNKPFSQPGDSGSLIIEHETKRPVGLLFAGGKAGDGREYTFANYIVNVKNELEIRDFLDKEIT